MNNNMKEKYIPCQLNVVTFSVERGFATSLENEQSLRGALTNAQNTFSLTYNQRQDNFQNQQYGRNDNIDWFGENSQGL